MSKTSSGPEPARPSIPARDKLSTAITNAPAQRLYEATGWKRDEDFYEYALSLCARGGVQQMRA